MVIQDRHWQQRCSGRPRGGGGDTLSPLPKEPELAAKFGALGGIMSSLVGIEPYRIRQWQQQEQQRWPAKPGNQSMKHNYIVRALESRTTQHGICPRKQNYTVCALIESHIFTGAESALLTLPALQCMYCQRVSSGALPFLPNKCFCQTCRHICRSICLLDTSSTKGLNSRSGLPCTT